MADPNKRNIIEYNGEADSGDAFDLGEFFTSYMQAVENSKATATAQINSAYDSLVESTNAQKDQIDKQADKSFREIYANAKVSANNQNEQLAALGLSRGNAQANSSGYGETSRIRQDVAMQNNLSNAAAVRDSNLVAVDSQINEINAQRAKELAQAEQEYNSQYLSAVQQLMQTQYNYYTWQQEFDYQKQADALSQQNWQAQFDYQKEQDALSQQNWQTQFDYQKQADVLSQQNWQAQFDYQKEQDALSQSNWQTEFNYQKSQDALEQQNWLAEYLLKQSQAAKSSSGSSDSDAAKNTDTAKTAQISNADLAAYQSEAKFNQYLQTAQSRASFPTDEAYASYFDQLYRQNDITSEQYQRALKQRGFSNNVINLRLGLLV